MLASNKFLAGRREGTDETREITHKFLAAWGFRPGPCYRHQCDIIAGSRVGLPGREPMFKYTYHWDFILIGVRMEETHELVAAATDEAAKSREVLEQLKNDVVALSDVIHPQLIETATKLRSARMTVVSEVNASLSAMRDVRKFFIEHDYEVEIARLERFIALCRELMALKEAGVLDAVADTTLRLAVKEESR